MSHVTEKDIEIMEACAREGYWKLAKWCNELNCWRWPKELSDEEPELEWSVGRRTALMNWITNRIGDRIINREWNRCRMTDDEHEDFWRSPYNRNAMERHQKRTDIQTVIDDKPSPRCLEEHLAWLILRGDDSALSPLIDRLYETGRVK